MANDAELCGWLVDCDEQPIVDSDNSKALRQAIVDYMQANQARY